MHAHHETYSLVEKKTGAVFADSLGRLFIYKDLPSAEKGQAVLRFLYPTELRVRKNELSLPWHTKGYEDE